MKDWRVGVDLGGTKTEVIVLDGASEVLFRERLPTPQGNYSATVETIAKLVSMAEAAVGGEALPVGVGIPGTVSRHTGRVKNANATWLNGQPLQDDLSARLGRQVPVSNDANCLAVSEATDGAGRGHARVFAALRVTGCGGGICHRARPLAGPNGVGGEWGHNPLPWTPAAELAARPCYCGRSGCQETFLSGTGLALSYARLTGRTLAADAVAALAAEGDEAASAVLEQYTEQLARGLAGVINLLDPDVIVLGGGVSNIDRLYRDLPGRLAGYVFGGECDTPVRRAVHGDSSGVRGAAWLNPLPPTQ